MTTKIHAGWGQSMGRPFCGARNAQRTTLNDREVTCQGCLRSMLAYTQRDAVRHQNALNEVLEMHNRYWRQLGYLRRKSGVDASI
jgi:hypothetical protein